MSVVLQVAPTEIIAKNDNDIGTRRAGSPGALNQAKAGHEE
jgi:hypothetical protein